MSKRSLKLEELKATMISKNRYRVKDLAFQIGLGVRTMERCFRDEYHTTPKVWMMRERISLAPPLLIEGLSNKEIAASLGYTRESNFARDFKRHFGLAPQKYVRACWPGPSLSRSDKQLSRFE